MLDRVKRIVYRKAIKSLQSKRNALLAEKINLHDWKIGHYQDLVRLNEKNIENAFSQSVRSGWERELLDNKGIVAYHQRESERLARELALIDEELSRLGVKPTGDYDTPVGEHRTQNRREGKNG